MLVAQDLVFDMARCLDVLFDEDPSIAERVNSLFLRELEAFLGLLVVEGNTHAFSTTTSAGFDHDWIADFVRDPQHL